MELAQERVSVSKACTTSGVPSTTALRWISKLESGGLVVRKEDPFDRCRAWLELSQAASAAMQRYVETLPDAVSSV